ncbi:hypothetical protein ACFFTM_00110 [Pseudoduganella plicata]|uniref:Uncharacterized protein n=1 Tax=Pseudoduganella plicata TaxID=321984 RepID=A0A4V1ATQ1_9BURK|nr:hypothetical protein [Pseudoduganella plicata]QBQ36448.1 hypothetical protein E1742_09950 [Pseudoduganella plicata]GGY75309.1 hypothetical protein GCM10007388_04740 [Pseudoduganella plicata]
MMRSAILALAALLHCCANAAGGLPDSVTGVWATASDTGTRTEMHLDADGLGMMIGSAAPLQHVDGKDGGQSGPRPSIGFPVRVTLDGATLTAQPFLPSSKAGRAIPAVICLHNEAAAAMTCTGPDGVPIALTRREATVSLDASRTLDSIRRMASPSSR